MTRAKVEIREFETLARKALDDFFEDRKVAALINKDEYPLRLAMVDWVDELLDGLTDRLNPRDISAPVLIVDNEEPVGDDKITLDSQDQV